MMCQQCLAEAVPCPGDELSVPGQFGKLPAPTAREKAKYVRPAPLAGNFPRPRLTLKTIMFLVAIWAIPNAIATWVLRSGYITGTPAQVRQWTSDTFLAVNLGLAFFVVWTAVMRWLLRVIQFKRAGGQGPLPVRKLAPRQCAALGLRIVAILVLIYAWGAAAMFLVMWLTPKIWPIQQFSFPLFALVMIAPLMTIAALRLWANPRSLHPIRHEWRTASVPERVSCVALFAWTLGLILAPITGGPSLLLFGRVSWFPIPPGLLIGVVGQLVLVAAVALTTRDR